MNASKRKNYKFEEKTDKRGSKKKFNKRPFKGDFDDSKTTKMSADVPETRRNDVSWYTKNAQMMKDAASIPWTYPLGNRVEMRPYDGYFPGIHTTVLVPGPGISIDENSPANIAGRDIYSFIRHKNSGHANYDPNDLMSYLLAVDEAYMLYYQAVRVYGAVKLYNNENRYGPKGIVSALGWDFEDVNANLAQFRYAINAFTVKLNALCVPKYWPYYARHAWIYSGIYADSQDAKAQLYAMVPGMYRRRDDATGTLLSFNLGTNTPVSDTNPVKMPSNITVQQWQTAVTDVINALLSSEDVGIMSGDILKAYGREGLINISPMGEDYTLIPNYSEEVLSQIQNLTVYSGAMLTDITMDNTINKGIVKYSPYAKVNKPVEMIGVAGFDYNKLYGLLPNNNQMLLNMHKSVIEPGDTMVATRLSAMGGNTLYKWDSSTSAMVELSGQITEGNVWIQLDTAGSEFVAGTYITYFSGSGSNVSVVQQQAHAQIFLIPNDNATYRNTVRLLGNMAKLDWSPNLWLTYIPKDGSITSGYSDFLMDVDTYTVVDRTTMRNLHESAILSEFDVPITY